MPQARWAITGTGVYWTIGTAGAVSTPRLEPPTGSEVEDARGTRGLSQQATPVCQHLSGFAHRDTEMRRRLLCLTGSPLEARIVGMINKGHPEGCNCKDL